LGSSGAYCKVSKVSNVKSLGQPDPVLALQNGNKAFFPLIFTISRQNDDEDTLRSQQHQSSDLGTV